MSERRFVFYEVGTIAPDSARGITESELKRRVEWIWLHPRASFSEIANVLLHGEGKEQERTSQCPNCGKIGGCDCYSKGYLDQPSPTPTREEWEAWKNRKPLAHEYTSYEAWTEAISSWILSIPVVPRGEK